MEGMIFDFENKRKLLEYARYHGLTCSCRQSDKDIRHHLPPWLNFDTAISNLRAELNLGLAPDHSFLLEKISLEEDARLLLSSIVGPAPVPELLFGGELEKQAVSLVKYLKLELPLLRTDNAFDLQTFYYGRKRAISFTLIELKPLLGNDDEDEGVSWSSRSLHLPSYYKNQAAAEKIEVDRDSMIWLHSALKPGFDDVGSEDDQALELGCGRKSNRSPLTPPLSPVRDHFDTEDILLSTHDIELLSEHTSPTVQISQALSSSLMKQDALRHPLEQSGHEKYDEARINNNDLAKIYSAIESDSNNLGDSSPDLFRASNLKLDEILTPIRPISALQSVLRSDDHTQFAACLPAPTNDQMSNSGVDVDVIFNEIIDIEACAANAELENEQLQEADSTMRVPVPVLDCSIPRPHWALSRPAEKLEEDIRELMLPIAKMKLYHLAGPKNERELRWVPFPMNLKTVAVEEEIQDEFTWQFMDLSGLGDDIDPQSLNWKPEGIRVLDDNDDHEDLEIGTFDAELDLAGLLGKRKIEVDTNIVNKPIERIPSGLTSKSNPSYFGRRSGEYRPCESIPGHGSKTYGPDSPFKRVFSASEQIGRYLELQTGRVYKKQKTAAMPSLDISTSDQITADSSDNRVAISVAQIGSGENRLLQGPTPNTEPVLLPEETIPVPDSATGISHPPRPIIVSSTIFSQQRQMVKIISSMCPSLHLVSRDFSTLPPNAENIPLPIVHQNPAKIENEADIIITPSTGIILTTLQKMKQKPLPGQGEFSALRARILLVCVRYEHLFVLVCASDVDVAAPSPLSDAPLSSLQGLNKLEPRSDALQPQDMEALVSLSSFAATLASIADITVSFIPPTTAPAYATARWILNLIHVNGLPCIIAGVALPQYTPPHQSAGDCSARMDDSAAPQNSWTLLQEETTWELLLRYAGLNAFAAQGVLLALKESIGGGNTEGLEKVLESESGGISRLNEGEETEKGGSMYGLLEFVLMSPQERRTRFSGMMGGVRVLDRVGAMFDKGWGRSGSKEGASKQQGICSTIASARY